MSKKGMVAALLAVGAWLATPAHAIVIDGNSSDWAGIDPVTTPVVDGLDALYFSRDAEYLYFWIDGNSLNTDGSNFGFGLDVDQNVATGCAFENGIGVEVGAFFIAPDFFNIGDASDCGWSETDFGSTWTTVFTDSGIEGALALSNLALFGWGGQGFDMVVLANGGWSAPFHVDLAVTAVPVVPAGLLTLVGLAGVLATRRRRNG